MDINIQILILACIIDKLLEVEYADLLNISNIASTFTVNKKYCPIYCSSNHNFVVTLLLSLINHFIYINEEQVEGNNLTFNFYKMLGYCHLALQFITNHLHKTATGSYI